MALEPFLGHEKEQSDSRQDKTTLNGGEGGLAGEAPPSRKHFCQPDPIRLHLLRCVAGVSPLPTPHTCTTTVSGALRKDILPTSGGQPKGRNFWVAFCKGKAAQQ